MANTSKKNTTEVLDVSNKVSPEELQKIIKKDMEDILINPNLSEKIAPTLISGSPGIGKSTIIKSIAKEMGIGFKDWRVCQLDVPDVRGLPVPNKETKAIEWYLPSELPRDEESAGIFLIDEINSADRAIQVALYQLILDRCLGDMYKLPKKWMIVCAGNETTDRAVATTMSSALANRFKHFKMEANAEDWISWARYNDVNPSVIGFISYRPEYLFHMEGENLERGWPSPRSWERVSDVINRYKGVLDDNTIRKNIYGLVGNRAGVEFMEFYKLNKEFDNVLEYMLNPNKEIEIPERADAKYALVSTMNYLLWRGKDEEDEKKRIDGFFRICINLPSDFATMAMTAAMAGTKKELTTKYCEKLFKHPKYKDWAMKHGKALRKRISI